MIVIGLCGNSGSGKSTVCKSFLNFGIQSIDADAVYRDLTKPNSELNLSLRSHFGPEILNEDFSLNRKNLSNIIFSDTTGSKRKLLNSITHSAIIDETLRRIEYHKTKGELAVIFDAPLLFESGFDKKCDIIIAVTADKDKKIERIMKRDSIDYSLASLRIASQLDESFLIKHANYVIDTTDGEGVIEARVREITENIFKCEV